MTDIVKEAREACWKVVSGPSNARLAIFLKHIRDNMPDEALEESVALAHPGYDWGTSDHPIKTAIDHFIASLEAQEPAP